jgi:uncharacterized protein YneF (UPF0154 family)
MMKKQTRTNDTRIEKVFITAGLSLLATGFIATIFGAVVNARFISDPLISLYYLRFIILLGGGFAVGFFFTTKTTKDLMHRRLFNGVLYALLASIIYELTFILLATIRLITSELTFPLGRLVFFGGPILALVITSLLGWLIWRRQGKATNYTNPKVILIFAFILSQLYSLANSTYYLYKGSAHYDPGTPLWQIIASYLLLPLVITAIAHFCLHPIKNSLNRAFYAVFIGALYSTFMVSFMEFRTDASAEATNIFIGIITTVTLLLTATLVWQVRKASSTASR